jgi:selenide, water dikinase
LNLMAIPPDVVPRNVVRAILRGGAAKIKEAGCVIVGGHTIKNAEPVYGLSVLGMVSPRRMITNAAAKPGDLLVLTKPLGTGIATTGIKRNMASASLARKAAILMSRLNTVGAELGERGLVRAATDVTGFGLLGHLGSICRASNVGAEIFSDRLPVIGKEVFHLIEQDCIPGGSRENLNTANSVVEWDSVNDAQKVLLTDAQTSGGLLLCVRRDRLNSVLEILKQFRASCAVVIGQIVRSIKPKIRVTR